MNDVFGTAGIRERVLAGWSAAPVRFREDANAEEDLALGGYADRLVIELAQNAADATTRAHPASHAEAGREGVAGGGEVGRGDVAGLGGVTGGAGAGRGDVAGGAGAGRGDVAGGAGAGRGGVAGGGEVGRGDVAGGGGNGAGRAEDAAGRGRVLFSFRENVLVVANTGAPLSAEGVESLATLRASAKREEGTVGRFGVGFSAVLAVTDEPVVLSRSGGVRFSRADTAAAVAELGSEGLDAEVHRRDGHVPALRLPFDAEGAPPEGYDTAVILPLRDDAAVQLVRRLLDEADDALLLALPALGRIDIEVDGRRRTLENAESRWYVERAAGTFDPVERDHLFADRPTEERSRPTWSIVWALPREGVATPGTVHAPTPTDEGLSLPALLLATFPLDPARRHVAQGALSDRLVGEAATVYARLLQRRAEDGADILPLVPAGLAAGALDSALREAISRTLPGIPLLRATEDGALLRPRDAVVVEGADEPFSAVLAPVVSGLVTARRTDRLALDALGVRRLDLSDLVDQLSGVAAGEPPEWWRRLYGSFSVMATDPLLREALGAVPVPLADGRLVRGARGLLLPTSDLPVNVLATFGEYGLRVVHPDAVDPALERLGALLATPRALLTDSAVRTAVEHSADADDPDALAEAVLALVQADPAQADGLWWLADLALRDADRELVPANALVIPGSDAEAVLDPDEVAPVDQALLDRYGAEPLQAVGVLGSLRLVTASDVPLDELPEDLADLDAIEDWADDIAPGGSRYGATVGELAAIRDLDWVRDDAWPRVLELVGSAPALRRALVTQVRAVGPDDRAVGVPSYSAWWIREHVLLDDGEPLAGRADPEADQELAAFLDDAPAWTAGLDPEVRKAIGLVRTAADLDPDGVAVLLDRLADPDRQVEQRVMLRVWSQLGQLTAYPEESPTEVRVLAEDGGTRVVPASAAVVADGPMWLQRTDLGGFVVATGVAADALGELLDVPLAAEVAAGKLDGGGTPAEVPAIVRELVPEVPAVWWEHEELLVDGVDVSWWVDADGNPHAATFDGLAKALAWSAGHWDRRHVLLTVLEHPDRAPGLLLDTIFDQHQE